MWFAAAAVLSGVLLLIRPRAKSRQKTQPAPPPLQPSHSGFFFPLLVLAAALVLGGLLIVRPPGQLIASGQGGGDAATSIAEVAGAREELAPPAAEPLGPPTPPFPLVPRALSTLDVRIGPAEGYIVLGLVPRGGALEVVGRDATGEWLAIVFSPGSKLNGWVPRQHVGNLPDLKTLPVAPVTLLP